MTRLSPIARAKDPLSSHAAAEQITKSGRRTGQCLAVLALVRKYPGKTSLELARLSGLDRYTVSRRLPELEDDGKVCRGKLRVCTVAKRQMLTWWPVSNEPPKQLELIQGFQEMR